MILLTESDTKLRFSRRKEKQKLPTNAKCKEMLDGGTEWQGPAPWDPSIGGNGFPKFLCDVMVRVLMMPLLSTTAEILWLSNGHDAFNELKCDRSYHDTN
uniref:Uncharacterized protein n=1 Tax=Arundo donax TaxID=35708 RepID=A0A0A9AY51_ARUDO